jgi:hypothetical protein
MGSNVILMAAVITIHTKNMQYEILSHSKNTVIFDDK